MWSRIKSFIKKAFTLESITVITVFVVSFYLLGIFVGEKRVKDSSPFEQVLQTVESQENSAFNLSQLQRGAIVGLLKATGDRWASYFPQSSAALLNQSLQGLYSGVGIWVRNADTSTASALQVSGVQPNSPASEAGIKPLDNLISVDGTNVTGMNIANVIALLRGEPGTKVELQLSRAGNQYRVALKRAALSNSQVESSQIAPNILYLQVTSFANGDAADIQSALNNFKHKDGVILDLRNNPGGLIDEAVNIASIFMGHGNVASFTIKNSPTTVLTSENPNPDRSPLVVLVNKATASSAEILAAALQERNRALVVGTHTFGKGTIQQITTLNDGSQVVLTVGQYQTANGSYVDSNGITPDLITNDQLSLKKAIAILTGLNKLKTGKK
jgi:carboxyl-terminal processing protease